VGKVRARIIAFVGTLVIGAIAFATGLVLFDEVVMPRWVHQGGDRPVPDLSNLNRQQAESVLARAGLKLSLSSERFDAAIPRGFVIAQDPVPGRYVKPGCSASPCAGRGSSSTARVSSSGRSGA
jgi:hypothetical protein